MERQLSKIYQKILNQLNDMISEKWLNIILYAEIFNKMHTNQFYYFSECNSIPTYCTDIWSELNVDREIYSFYDNQLYNYFIQLRQTFIDHGQEPWTNLTIRFDCNGKFSIEYHYDDFTVIDAYTRLLLWKHIIAQVPLHDSYEIKTANEYVEYLQKKIGCITIDLFSGLRNIA
jgi:hypothetical protein